MNATMNSTIAHHCTGRCDIPKQAATRLTAPTIPARPIEIVKNSNTINDPPMANKKNTTHGESSVCRDLLREREFVEPHRLVGLAPRLRTAVHDLRASKALRHLPAVRRLAVERDDRLSEHRLDTVDHLGLQRGLGVEALVEDRAERPGVTERIERLDCRRDATASPDRCGHRSRERGTQLNARSQRGAAPHFGARGADPHSNGNTRCMNRRDDATGSVSTAPSLSSWNTTAVLFARRGIFDRLRGSVPRSAGSMRPVDLHDVDAVNPRRVSSAHRRPAPRARGEETSSERASTRAR